MFEKTVFAAAIALSLCNPASADSADDLVKEASSFCSKTSTGKSYPSFQVCMDYQRDAIKALVAAAQKGHQSDAVACIKSSIFEGFTDFGAAGLCLASRRPELFLR